MRSGDRHGSRGNSRAGRVCASSPRSSRAHEIAIAHDVAETAISAPRQPPSSAASGTTIAAVIVAPSWIPVV
ncbi:MAG: hypothetical protein M5U27_06230 [Gaiella sp.]|nr:hypothetical protein [Gaiella sp.]